MRLLISKKAAVVATVAALPFVGTGFYFFIRAFTETRWPEDAIFYGIYGTLVFMLGSPLTLLYVLAMPYIGRLLIWSIGNDLAFLVPVVYTLLFVTQWIMWSQLIAWAHRKFRRTLP